MTDQPITINIPSDPQATLREMAARNANLSQEVAMLQGQIQTLLNLLTPEQVDQLKGLGQEAQPNRAARRARQSPKKPAGKAVSNGASA